MVFIQKYFTENKGWRIINLHGLKSIGFHWIVLHLNGNNGIYFDSFGVEYISKEI